MNYFSNVLGLMVAIITIAAGSIQIIQYLDRKKPNNASIESKEINRSSVPIVTPSENIINSMSNDVSQGRALKFKTSFDCKKAFFIVEKVICSDEIAAIADINLARVYSKIYESISSYEKTILRKSQTDWIVDRRKVCSRDRSKFENLTDFEHQEIAKCIVIYNRKRQEILESFNY